jgi:hypothetical protein
VRRLIFLPLAAVLLAACSPNAPSETPIRPWLPPTLAPTPTPNPNAPTPAPVDTSTWIVFAPAGEGFSVKLPGEPTVQAATVQTEAGPVPTTTWSYAQGSEWVMAVVRARGSFQGEASGILDTALQVMASQSQATLTSKSSVTVSGRPGMAFSMSAGDASITGEMVLAGDLYGVYFAGPPGSASAGLAEALIASFELTS